MVTRMDRLVVAELVGPFVFGVLLFTSLFFAGGEVMRAAEFLGKGVPLTTVGKLLILTLPFFLAMTLPMAMLLAALLGFGRLSNDSEIVALLAAGASFKRIMVPVAAFALLVSLMGLWFGDAVVPAANRGRHAIIAEAQNGAGGMRSSSAFDLSLRDDGLLTTQIHVEDGVDLTASTGGKVALRQVSVETWSQGRMISAVYAGRAEWVPGSRNWRLYDVQGGSWNGESTVIINSAASLEALENAHIRGGNLIELGTPEELSSLSGKVEDASIRELRERSRIYRKGNIGDKAREAEVEMARRIVLPFASLVFALVGAPLGVRPQRAGKGLGFGLSILIIFAYWIALNVAAFFGKSGLVPPLVALWIPNLAGVGAALFLMRRVLR